MGVRFLHVRGTPTEWLPTSTHQCALKSPKILLVFLFLPFSPPFPLFFPSPQHEKIAQHYQARSPNISKTCCYKCYSVPFLHSCTETVRNIMRFYRMYGTDRMFVSPCGTQLYSFSSYCLSCISLTSLPDPGLIWLVEGFRSQCGDSFDNSLFFIIWFVHEFYSSPGLSFIPFISILLYDDSSCVLCCVSS